MTGKIIVRTFKMCTAYDTIVKEFQTNLASFVNVRIWISIAGEKLKTFFSGGSNVEYLHAKLSKDNGQC